MKKDETPIDEKKLMEMMAQPFSKDRELPEMGKTKSKKTETKSTKKQKEIIKAISKEKGTPYKELFLQKTNLTARNGKSIYIQPEMHEVLFRITRVIAGSNISVSNYLDNILRHHFAEYETEIKKQFKEKYKPIL
ncbi:DUF3408 domain-containing protein [Tenacibaculum piscium]|uniref:DUF3408 domain-containing protein n=1 Tax=Tenacibaculum piscium TaxID=1458515 RepID=UPI001F1B1C26|nr:DUF3408 domain-containing protein [Tenacibaculum piscium]